MLITQMGYGSIIAVCLNLRLYVKKRNILYFRTVVSHTIVGFIVKTL
jgi:hypothetical protein